jgi:hypothetical protein
MPLLRYFLYVGGALLSLILIANLVLPQEPPPATLTSGAELPPVRIHSARKLPDPILFDTRSTVAAEPLPMLPSLKIAEAVTPAPALTADMSAKARVREAFAQLPTTEDVAEPKMDGMARVVVPAPKMHKVKGPPKRVAASRLTRRARLPWWLSSRISVCLQLGRNCRGVTSDFFAGASAGLAEGRRRLDRQYD